MKNKMKAGIIGSGNIGTDLMMKLLRSEILVPTVMIGVDVNSTGLKRAQEYGLKIFSKGINEWEKTPDTVDLFFDATSASAHLHNAEVAKKHEKIILDLTPAALGPYVIPTVNLSSYLNEKNLNLVTCGGQATVPIVAAVSDVQSVKYAEIVSTISSKSAGPGTRQNIDEFTKTTKKALEKVGGAETGKAIILLNPADPPILMRDTIYVVTDELLKEKDVINSIDKMIERIQKYVPGYHLHSPILCEGNQVTVIVEVEGAGDFLPKYSGNLDIMTSAAIQVGEAIATK